MALLAKLRAGDIQVDDQPFSLLFRLPVEVRVEIYHHVYPRHLLHLKKAFFGNAPWCAFWCIELRDYRHGYTHLPCHWFEKSKKQMLGLPLTCRRLYLETIQTIYSRHTFHLYNDLTRQWASNIPRIHLGAITSIRLTSLTFDSMSAQEYKETWEVLSSLANLEKLFVMIGGCETAGSREPNMLPEKANPVKLVQQKTIKTFDLIFGIYKTWFPGDDYMKIEYNKLQWDTFLLDLSKFPAFDGIHPRCRVIGMNNAFIGRPLHDNMPTMDQLLNWFSWFSCNPAYGYLWPEGYDGDEIGSKETARRQKIANITDDDKIDRCLEGKELRDKLEAEYGVGEHCNDDPETWDLAALTRAGDLIDDYAEDGEPGNWTFPEKPSWIQNGTLEQPHEFPPPMFESLGSE